MHVETQPMKCRECGSTNSEHFVRRHESGIRCLNCGHKAVHSIANTGSGTAYTLTADDVPTF